jgi:general secretion pathway protein L
MRKQMLIQMPAASADDATAAAWLLRDEEQPGGRFFQGPLTDAATQAMGARVVALVPGADVLLTRMDMPNLNRSNLAKALPYALEEQLASDVEELHVAIGNRDASGRVANAVVSRRAIDSWLENLKQAGVHADVLASEVFGVPLEEDAGTVRWGLLVDGARAFLRTAPQAGLAAETENLPAVFQALLDEAGDAPPAELSVTVCGADVFSASSACAALRALCEGQGMALKLRHSAEACPVLLAQGFNEQEAINLLQGDYSRKQQLEKLLRPWLPAAVVLGLWLVLHIGLTGFEYVRLSAEDKALRAQIEAVYREAFPDARNVVNPKVQMEQALAKLHGGSKPGGGFLSLLAESGKVFKDTTGLKLRNLRYKEGRLEVDLEVADLQILDNLKQRLMDEAKLKVEIVSASSRDDKVETRITVAGGGA